MASIFDFPHGEIYEFTPLAGLAPPSGIGKGTIIRDGNGQFHDKTYIYKWDGYHEGGEWEVYHKSTGKHVGVLDPTTGTWHAKKGAKPGRTLTFVFSLLVRSKGTVFFGPILIESSLGDIPESGLKILDSSDNESLLEQFRNEGIIFPESLYWRFGVGVEIHESDLQRSLIKLSEECAHRWRARLG